MTRTFQEIMIWSKRKSFVKSIKEEKRLFKAQLQTFPVLQQLFTTKGNFSEKDRYALHLSYATLVTYVPVLGPEQFQFPCRVIFENSA